MTTSQPQRGKRAKRLAAAPSRRRATMAKASSITPSGIASRIIWLSMPKPPFLALELNPEREPMSTASARRHFPASGLPDERTAPDWLRL